MRVSSAGISAQLLLPVGQLISVEDCSAVGQRLIVKALFDLSRPCENGGGLLSVQASADEKLEDCILLD